MKARICMIVPAAGQSRRHPPNKLLLPIEGVNVLEKTIALCVDEGLETVVVTGHQAHRVRPLIQARFGKKVRIVHNPSHREGMSTSLKTALRHLEKEEWDAWGILPADKPFLKQETLSLLVKRFRKEKPLLLAPEYMGRSGHPVFFSKKLRKDLLAITGDVGGRDVLNHHRKDAVIVPVDDEGVLVDMDLFLERRND